MFVTSKEDMIGKKFFVRTVTYHSTGEVVGFCDKFMIMKDAAWIADSGRFHNAIMEGILSEVEPVEIIYINMDSIVDMFPWNHPLPREQK